MAQFKVGTLVVDVRAKPRKTVPLPVYSLGLGGTVHAYEMGYKGCQHYIVKDRRSSNGWRRTSALEPHKCTISSKLWRIPKKTSWDYITVCRGCVRQATPKEIAAWNKYIARLARAKQSRRKKIPKGYTETIMVPATLTVKFSAKRKHVIVDVALNKVPELEGMEWTLPVRGREISASGSEPLDKMTKLYHLGQGTMADEEET